MIQPSGSIKVRKTAWHGHGKGIEITRTTDGTALLCKTQEQAISAFDFSIHEARGEYDE